MAGNADGRLIIETFLDEKGVNDALKALGNGSAAEAAEKALKNITKAVAATSAALVGLAAVAIKIGADFEAGMSEVAAISGATGDDLQALTDLAKEMGAKTKFSASEAAEGLKYMAMAGWDTRSMLDGLEGIMNLAAASGEDLGLVSDIVTDSLTAFGLAASDSAHFADVLAVASNASNTNVAMMGATFKYAAAVAGALGYSIEDVAVATGLMANAGIKGEQAGTALRAMFSRMAAPTKEAAAAMEDLGLRITNSDGSMRDLSDVLVQMRKGFAELSESEKAATASALAGTEAMSGLLAIVNASDKDFDTLTAAIGDASGAAMEMAAVMQDNLQGDVEILKSALEDLGIQIYESFQRPLRDATQAATRAVEKITAAFSSGKMKATLDKLAESLAKIAQGIADLVINVLPVLIDAFAWLIDNLPFVISLWGGLTLALKLYNVVQKLAAAEAVVCGVAMEALAGSIGWVSVAIVGVTALLGILVTGIMNSKDAMAEYRAETEEMAAAHDSFISSIDEMTAAHDDAMTSIDAEAASARMLDARLRSLADKTDRTASETATMYELIEELNRVVPDLNQAYDEQAGALQKTQTETYKAIEAKKALAKQEAAQAQMTEVAKGLLEIELQRAERSRELEAAQKDQAAAQATLNAAQADWNAHMNMGTGLGAQYINTLHGAENAYAATTDRVNGLEAAMGELDAKEASLNGQFDTLIDFSGAASASMGDVAKSTDAAADAAARLDDVYRETYVNAYEHFSKQIDLFAGVKNAAKTSVKEIIKSMREQADATFNYADNIKKAMEMGVDKGLIKKLSDGSTESALILNEIVKNGGDNVDELNNEFRRVEEGTAAATDAVGKLAVAIQVELDGMVGDAAGAADNMIDGLVGALKKRLSDVRRAAGEVADNVRYPIERKMQIQSPSKVMAQIGEYIIEGLIKGVSDTEAKLVRVMHKTGDAITDAMLENIDARYKLLGAQEEQEIEKLEERISEIKKKKITKRNEAAIDAEHKALELQKLALQESYKAEKQNLEDRKKLLDDLKKAYEKAYDEIIRSQDRLEEKLKSFGSLYKTLKVGDVEIIQLADIQKDINLLKTYGDQLEALKKKGAPEGFLDEILDMGVEEGSKFMSVLLSQTDTDFDTYMSKWEEKQSIAAGIAKTFYSDKLDELKKGFTDKVTQQLMDTSSDAFAAGKAAAEAYANGMKSVSVDTSGLTSAVQSETGTLYGQISARYGNTTTATTTNSSTNIYNQAVNINQPVESPAATARAVQRASEDLINGT